MSGYTVRPAVASDLPGVLSVQHTAFMRVAAEHGIDPERLAPIQESIEDLRELDRAGTRFFVALSDDDAVIGSVRALEREGTVEIGRLVVDDGWERRGVATALMDELERAYPHAARFELFTGAEAHGPLALYANRGYREFRREQTPAVELVWLERPGAGR